MHLPRVARSPFTDPRCFSVFKLCMFFGERFSFGVWALATSIFSLHVYGIFFPGSRCFGVSFDSTIPLGCIYRRSSSMQPFNQLRP